MDAQMNPEFNIGQRLKAARTERNLSQRELARKSGVTNGMISQIEGNNTSPSVSSLKRILDALPLTLSEFFSGDSADNEQIFFRAAELQELNPQSVFGAMAGDCSGLSLRQAGRGHNSTIQMLHEHYAPGSDTGTEPYQHTGEEVGFVISGCIEVTVGGQTAILGPGDAYAFDSRVPHRFHNKGETECIVVSACTPPTF